MNEKGKNKREWVKTAAIIFLSVLLVLTFFSNTIMNYSLPEVATKYVEPGSITAKIRGNGVVESADPYNITVKQTRKVSSVAVKAGDTVQKGDVLVYLEDRESTELEAARKELEAAEDAYEELLLRADVDAGIIQNSHSNISSTSYRQLLDAALAEVDRAKSDVEDWKAKVASLEAEIAQIPSNDADVDDEKKALEEAKTAKENADFALTAAQNTLADLEAKLEYEDSVSASDAAAADRIAKLKAQKQEAEKKVIDAQATANNAKLAYDKAQTAYNNKFNKGDTASDIKDLDREKRLAEVNLASAETEKIKKENQLAELAGDIKLTLNLENLYQAVADAREKVNKEAEKAIGAAVTADIAGTIIQMNAVAGKEISAADVVAVIQPEGKGYTMSFGVTNEQALRLSVGDKAELINSWYYNDLEVTLTSIRPDPSNPGKQKLLTFEVKGDVTAGQTLNVSVGQKSANYDYVIPNSAIREDNNGKFILRVDSKDSPLGNRYIANRVDVEVLASDDTKSAVNGALSGYEFIITTSNKPVEAGQQVRLPDDN